MKHRHLEGEGYTGAHVDDVIARGELVDWIDLRERAKTDQEILRTIFKMSDHGCRRPEFPECPPLSYIAWFNWSARRLGQAMQYYVWVRDDEALGLKDAIGVSNLYGVETTIQNLSRNSALDRITVDDDILSNFITLQEALRTKAALILTRNSIRDYLGFVEMAHYIGVQGTQQSLDVFDDLYKSKNGASPLQQMIRQLSSPFPGDMKDVALHGYGQMAPGYQSWEGVAMACCKLSVDILEWVAEPVEKDAEKVVPDRQKC